MENVCIPGFYTVPTVRHRACEQIFVGHHPSSFQEQRRRHKIAFDRATNTMGETQSRPVSLEKRSKRPDTIPHSRNDEDAPLDLAPFSASFYLSSLLATSKVHCASSEETPPPPLPSAASLPPPAPDVTDATTTPEQDSIERAAAEASRFPNPGTHEMVLTEGKRILMLDTFDGFRCDINKQVSPFMMAVHSFHLGTSMLQDGRKNNYTFTTQVADDQGALMARVDPGRNSVECRIQKGLLGGLAMGRIQGMVTKDGQADQLIADIDAGGMTWAGNLKYGSMGNGNCFGLGFMQTVHPNVIMGVEGMYLGANKRYISSYLMKINWTAASTAMNLPADTYAPKSNGPTPPGMPPSEMPGQSMLCLNYNSGMGVCTANYKQTVAPNRLTLGAELQFSPLSPESQLLVGAEYKWNRSKLSLCIDGGGRIQSVLDSKIGMAPSSPSLMLSADVDHYNDTMRFGYGLTVDS